MILYREAEGSTRLDDKDHHERNRGQHGDFHESRVDFHSEAGLTQCLTDFKHKIREAIQIARSTNRHSSAVSSLNWKLRFLPRFPAPRHIPKILESFRLQDAGGNTSPVPAPAINRRRLF